jgi:excinuclease ABC subunit A
LRKLLDAGHSLLVIEHNLDVIRASRLDRRPRPRRRRRRWRGGVPGTPEDVKAHATSHTGRALREYEVTWPGAAVRAEEGRRCRPAACAAPGGTRRRQQHPHRQCQREHNLKSLNVDIPRGKFNVITGVSARARARWPSTSCSTKASGATWKA